MEVLRQKIQDYLQEQSDGWHLSIMRNGSLSASWEGRHRFSLYKSDEDWYLTGEEILIDDIKDIYDIIADFEKEQEMERD